MPFLTVNYFSRLMPLKGTVFEKILLVSIILESFSKLYVTVILNK